MTDRLLETECCGVLIAPDHRFCPKCGHEARVLVRGGSAPTRATDYDVVKAQSPLELCRAELELAQSEFRALEAESAARIAQLSTLREKIWTGADQQTIANWLNELDALITKSTEKPATHERSESR